MGTRRKSDNGEESIQSTIYMNIANNKTIKYLASKYDKSFNWVINSIVEGTISKEEVEQARALCGE